jgi:hypothetical protein
LTGRIDDGLNLQMRRRLLLGARIRQRVMGFLDDYGLSASLPEKYGEPELPFCYVRSNIFVV